MANKRLTSNIKDKHGNQWSITSNNVYESIITNAPLYSKIDAKNHYDLAGNIAGQFQLLEFTELLLNQFEFETEGEVEIPEFIGEGTVEIHNEVEHALFKQGHIAVATIAETICYMLIKTNNIKLKDRFGFSDLIRIAGNYNLINKTEVDLLHKLRLLRNSVHLHTDSYDVSYYHEENYETAKACLYLILIKFLKIDERVMMIHFPYLPKRNKQELSFEL
jgi:hypothetical protein